MMRMKKYDLFPSMIQGVFEKIGELKTLEPIKINRT
jgi:hypothetical protein